jgi:hypothetical protein
MNRIGFPSLTPRTIVVSELDPLGMNNIGPSRKKIAYPFSSIGETKSTVLEPMPHFSPSTHLLSPSKISIFQIPALHVWSPSQAPRTYLCKCVEPTHNRSS